MSSKHQATFLERYLNGEVPAEDIDDYVDQWHAKSGKPQIYEFLGLSRDEYALWLRHPDLLPQIAHARREHLPLASVIALPIKKHAMAAGSSEAIKKNRSTPRRKVN